MDHVFGVMEHDGLGRALGLDLIRDQRVVKMVEAVGFGGRAIGFDLDRMDARVVDARNGCRGRRIVAVMADEDAVIVIIEALQGGFQHGGDDRGFVPGGHEHGDETGLRVEHPIAGVGRAVAAIDGDRAPHPPGEIDQIDDEVVDPEQQEAGAGEQGQLGRGAADHCGKIHAGSGRLAAARR